MAGVEAANKKQKDSTGSSAAVPQDDGIDSQIQQLINQHCMMIRVHEDVGAKVSNKKQKSAMKSTLDRISATVLFAGMDDAKASAHSKYGLKLFTIVLSVVMAIFMQDYINTVCDISGCALNMTTSIIRLRDFWI